MLPRTLLQCVFFVRAHTVCPWADEDKTVTLIALLLLVKLTFVAPLSSIYHLPFVHLSSIFLPPVQFTIVYRLPFLPCIFRFMLPVLYFFPRLCLVFSRFQLLESLRYVGLNTAEEP